MQAIIVAGGTLKADAPLFTEYGIAQKALLPIGGKPMVQWVFDAISGSERINRIVVVGLKPDDLEIGDMPTRFIDDQGHMIDNVLAAVKVVQEVEPEPTKVLLSSSDIPLITTEIVNEFIDICLAKEGQIQYAVVNQQTMEARFPNSKRTFTPMKGGRYAGGDIILLDTRAVDSNIELFKTLSKRRKNFLAQARMVGFVFIFKFIFRMMDIHEAGERAAKALNVTGEALDYHRAEIAMDVDKLNQYLLVKNELESRAE